MDNDMPMRCLYCGRIATRKTTYRFVDITRRRDTFWQWACRPGYGCRKEQGKPDLEINVGTMVTLRTTQANTPLNVGLMAKRGYHGQKLAVQEIVDNGRDELETFIVRLPKGKMIGVTRDDICRIEDVCVW